MLKLKHKIPRRMLSLSVVMLSLTGCALADSNPIYLTRCPALVAYPADVQGRAADELAAMPPTAVLPQFMADYATLRQTCRAFQRGT